MTPAAADNRHINSGIKMQTVSKSETGAGTASDSGKNISGPLDREQLLNLSSDLVKSLHERVMATRFKSRTGDRDRLAFTRALTQLLNTYSGILKDSEIADLEKRIATLEAQKQKEGGY